MKNFFNRKQPLTVRLGEKPGSCGDGSSLPSMPVPAFPASHVSKRGMALVLVLTVVVLITILVAAFASVAMLERASSKNYAESLRAEEIARSGYANVVADMRLEILAGSTTNAGAPGFFMPRTNWTMVPQTNIALTNGMLVRITSPTPPLGYSSNTWFDTNQLPTNRASAVVSSTASRNGRRLTTSTWLAPRLIPTNSAAAIAAFSNNLPRWTYVTRTGGRTLTDANASSASQSGLANTNYVTGRYAYAIYDTGGLLDANLAGADTNVLAASWVASKANQAFADLTQVGLSQANIAALVQWRNAVSGVSSNSYSSYLRFSGPTNGFTVGALGDRQFFSRRDFLRYADANGWPPDAIAAFTTFQRDPAAPGFFPTYDAVTYRANSLSAFPATNSYRMAATDASAGNANPAFLGVTDASGNPAAKARFNLDRLLWLTREGPIASLSTSNPIYTAAFSALGGGPKAADFLAQGTSANIQKYFGLVWDGSPASWTGGPPTPTTGELGQQWVYCSPTGSLAARPSGIKTLAQSATENREPDLFELVRASILRGSLGFATGDPNVSSVDNPNAAFGEWERRFCFLNGIGMSEGKTCNTRELRLDKDNKLFHAEPKYQVARIVGNIVDQADPDSYPTSIRLNEEVIWGMEDLPLINGVGIFAARPPTGNVVTPNANSEYIHKWANIALWNPHSPSPAGAGPDTIRIVCRSGLYSFRMYSQGYYQSGTSGSYEFNWLPNEFGRNFSLAPASIEFPISAYAGFREPSVITPNAATTSNDIKSEIKIGSVDLIGLHLGFMRRPENPRYAPQFAGVPLLISGATPRTAENIVPLNVLDFDTRGLMPENGTSMNLELQYRDSGGRWRTYDVIYGFVPYWSQFGWVNYIVPGDANYATSMSNVIADSGASTEGASVSRAIQASGQNPFFDPAYIRIDPRTTRLNMGRVYSAQNKAGRIDQTLAPTDAGNRSVYNDQTGFGENSASSLAGTFFFTPSAASKPGASMYANNYSEFPDPANYSDPDLVQRWGDGGLRADNHPGSPGNFAARPVILNRPFRNVGELGVVFRDMPWRTVDLLSVKSADSGLLEIFCVGELSDQAVAGRINVNSAPPAVMRAMLSGADRMLNGTSTNLIPASSATNVVNTLVANRAASGPMESLSQISQWFAQTNAVSSDYPAPKVQREAAMRALAGVGTTRPWNVLVDVVAQSGRLASGAANLSSDFIVEGQKRFWFQVSIDRLTGEVIASKVEPVED